MQEGSDVLESKGKALNQQGNLVGTELKHTVRDVATVASDVKCVTLVLEACRFGEKFSGYLSLGYVCRLLYIFLHVSLFCRAFSGSYVE
jgi:hypothetical protein